MELRVSALAFCCLVSTLASAGPVVRWHCAYASTEVEAVLCQRVEAPDGNVTAPSLPGDSSPMPRLAADILDALDTLYGETIAIPLYSRPVDMARVGILARDVMCGKRPDCEVEFSASRNGLADSSATAKPPAEGMPPPMMTVRRDR
ncbi:MAG TPA: hypothetical protein VFV55_01390 [Usitatibacteraceae bacterium]|nr:hypothetical protein [Usitatibacteraceae bacterium]